MRLKLRLTMPDADFKRSSTRSISWSELVVRGGVEPPTFRFSGVADIQVGACHRSVDGCRCASMAGVGCRRCRQRCRRRGQVIRDVVVPIITRLVTQQGRGEPRRLAGSAVFPGTCRLIAFENFSRTERGGGPCLDQVMFKRHSPWVHTGRVRGFRVPSPRADTDGEVLDAAAAGQIRELLLVSQLVGVDLNLRLRCDGGLLDRLPGGKVCCRAGFKYAHVQRDVSGLVAGSDLQGRARARHDQALGYSVHHVRAVAAQHVVGCDVVIACGYVVRVVVYLQLVRREWPNTTIKGAHYYTMRPRHSHTFPVGMPHGDSREDVASGRDAGDEIEQRGHPELLRCTGESMRREVLLDHSPVV